MSAITLKGSLDADAVAAMAHGARIEFDDSALSAVAANRAVFEEILASGTPLYGITTGFGALVSERVAPEFHRGLQVNLLRSHASGTGEELSREVVRAALVIRLNSLLRAHSGVRPVVLERIREMLNHGYVPRVPRTGSLGAS